MMKENKQPALYLKSSADWVEMCEPLWLGMLPLNAAEFSLRFDATFTAVEEVGIGEVYYVYAQVNGRMSMLKTYALDPNEGQQLSLYALGEELQPDEVANDWCRLCGIDTIDMLHLQSDNTPGEWVVFQEEKGVVKEWARLPDDFRAEQTLTFLATKYPQARTFQAIHRSQLDTEPTVSP